MTPTTTPKSGARPAAAITTWRTAPTRTIRVGGTPFVYRELGPRSGVPLVFLHHFTAVLDDWDPRVIDGIAAKRHVIAFDNRGIGASGGSVPHTIDEWLPTPSPSSAPSVTTRSIFSGSHSVAASRR
jgi:pimeloyl-ACP methyl ester carboxylesterase